MPRADLGGGACEIGLIYVNKDDGNKIYSCRDDGGGTGKWGLIQGVWTQDGDNAYLTDYTNPNLYIGIGTNTPQSPLDVRGAIRVGQYTTATLPSCNSSNKGAMVYNTDTNSVQSCDSSAWRSPAASSQAGVYTTASRPACTVSNRGQIILNADNNEVNVCGITGTWRTMSTYSENLTFAGTTHSETDCTDIGGVIYNTGAGTLCKLSGTNISCPAGWTQARAWQQYASSPFGGDFCGRWLSTGPTTFSDQDSYIKHLRGGAVSWYNDDQCSGLSAYWCHKACPSPTGCLGIYNYDSLTNDPDNRSIIGCK